MGIERIAGNYGTTRVNIGVAIAFPIADWYWNRQWTVNYIAASETTLTKIVKLSYEDLSAFYIKARSKSGSLVLHISQGSVTKDIDISGEYYKVVEMVGFSPGLVKLVLSLKSAKNVKVLIGWRQ